MKLPKGFEKTIIELEVQLEKAQGGQELITTLLSLYSVITYCINYRQIGVEHYDSIGDQKTSSMYREKIQILLTKPFVMQECTLIQKKASNQ